MLCVMKRVETNRIFRLTAGVYKLCEKSNGRYGWRHTHCYPNAGGTGALRRRGGGSKGVVHKNVRFHSRLWGRVNVHVKINHQIVGYIGKNFVLVKSGPYWPPFLLIVISFLLTLESVNKYSFERKSNLSGIRCTGEPIISGNPWDVRKCSCREGIHSCGA